MSARQKLTVLNITVKESVDNLSFPSMLLESQISPKPLAKRLILNFFPRDFFLSMRMTGYFDVTCDQRSLKASLYTQCIVVLETLEGLN